MANLEKFTRYRDNPTLKEPGTSPVATSIEQLEKMTLEERQRVVASIEVLTKYSAKLKDEVAKLAGQLSSADLDKIKAGLEDSLAGRVDEVLKKIEQEERSLDIKNLWFGIQSNAPEIRWEKPNWNKPYDVEVYISQADSTDLVSATLQYTVKSPKDYHIFSDNIEGKYVFVRAKDIESGTYGKFSPVVRVEDRDVRLAKFLEYIQGKIKVTALDEKLIAALKEDIHQATQQQIEDELGRVRSEVETTKGQIQNTINAVRESSEQSWSQLRDTVLRNGTNISNIQRKADGLTEEIKTISAKADNAVAGVENINTVIAEKDSAVRREIQNAITQVESTRTEVKRELIQTATNLESKLTAEKDARTQLGNNLARTTEKVDQLATESDSLKRKTTQIETDVAGNKTKTQQLEENISNLDSSTTKKLESIKSSFNNDHFYNYNMAGGTDGWMLEDFNQDITAKVNTDVGPEDLRYPNLLTSIVNTGNIFVKSTQVKPIEREKTYRLTATFKTRSTQANLKEANLYFLPFDKNGNKHRPQDGLLNRKGGAKYPLIQAKTEVQPNGWVTLTGEISTWSSSYPITTAAEANMIPLPTVFACPALELVGKQGAGSFEVDIAVLDLKDISDEKSVSSQIDTVKRTLSDENKALAQQFTSQTSQFKSDVIAQMTELSKSVTEAQKASNTRIDDMNTRLGDSNSKIQRLEQTVNDEKSSNALKIDTLRADFNKSKANQIDFDLDKTPTFEVNPQTKFRIIDKSAATLISRDYVSAYPANKYLKFWGDTLEFNRNNRLPVKSGDKLYASAEIFSKTADVSVYVKYLDENGNLVGRDGSGINLVGSLSTNNSYTKIESDNNLVVPNNTEIKFAQLSISTGKNTLSEEDDSILISNPQLRHYDETAIKSDAKLNDLKIAVSSEVQSYAERTQGIEAELNGRLAQNNIKQTARAEADEVATSKVETAKSELKGSISNIQDTQTTLSNTVKAQAEELKTVKSDYKSDIAKANSRIDSTNTTLNDRYSSLSSKADTLESNYRALDDKYTQSEARNKAERSALASKDEAITRKLDEQSTKIQGAETKVSTLENTQTNDRQAFTNFKRDTESKFQGNEAKINSLEQTQVNDRQAFTTFKRDAESKLDDSSSKISKLEKTTTDLSGSIAETSKSLKSEFTNNLNTAKTELRGKIDQNERTASDQYRTLTERTTTLESKANTVDGRINSAIVSERTNTEATANRVAAEKSSELKVQFDARLSADQNNLLSFTNTMGWYVDKAKDETQTQSIEDNIATLRGDTTNWKHAYQFSKEGDKASDPKASKALTTVQPDLPYFLTFEARSNIEGNVLNPILRLYYKDVNNAKQWRNSNVPSVPLVDEWRTYQVSLTAPLLKANETRNYFGLMLEMKSTGKIQVRNPRLVYDAKTAIERINASIVETKQLAVDASGKVRAKIGLKVNANGKAVGWSSEVNGDTNNFSINADNFKIANGADDYTPFSINATEKKIMFNGEVAFTKGTNLLKNPTMSMAISLPNASDISPLPLDSILNWRVSSSSMVEVRRPESNWSPNVVYYPNEVCIDIRNDNKTARALERTGWLYQDVSVTPGNWYMFSGWVASHESKCRLLIEEINSSGGYIKQIGGTDYVNPSGGRDLSNYTRLFMKFKANSPNIRVGLEQINLANQTTTSVLQSWLFRPMLEECSENATGPSAWSNSNVGTVIDGDQLKTNTISVDKLSFSPSAVNLLVNSQLMPLNPETQDGSPLFWSFYDNASRSRDLCRCQNLGKSEWSGGVDGRVERIYTNNSGPNEFTGAGWRHLIAQDVWLTPGTYIFSFYSANHGANPNRLLNSNFDGSGNRLIPRFERLDSNRNFVPSLNGFATGIQVVERGVIPSGRGDFYYGYGNADRGWIKCNVTASTWYRIGIGVSSSSNSERSELWFGRPMLELVPSTQNLPSLFSHSVTRVDKDSLYVPKLSALSANMGDITAGSLNINNRAKISTDGTLTATGANINGTITATGGSITGDLYVGDRNGGYVLISGSQKAIIVYEGTVPKVRLGKL